MTTQLVALPIAPPNMHIPKQRREGIWDTSHPQERGLSYLSKKRAQKAGGKQMRERNILSSDQPLCESHLLFEPPQKTQEQIYHARQRLCY